MQALLYARNCFKCWDKAVSKAKIHVLTEPALNAIDIKQNMWENIYTYSILAGEKYWRKEEE